MKRFWEIDALRGTAIIAMVVFHAVYILVFLNFFSINLHSGFWWVFPRCIAGTFLLVVGVSLTLSYNRVKHLLSRNKIIQKYVLRGIFILLLGFIITIVSFFIYEEQNRVFFGILHLIGTSIIIAIPFITLSWSNLFIGCIVLVSGLILGNYKFDFFWLFWLGFRPVNYFPVDYLPLFPWISFVFFGMFFGNICYKENKRIISLPDIGDFFLIRGLRFLGRISLYIYLVHIPLIYGLLYGYLLVF